MKKAMLVRSLILASCFGTINHLDAQTWSSPQEDGGVQMGGADRLAPAAAVYNGSLYMAYLNRNSPANDRYSDYYVYVGSQTGGGAFYDPTTYVNPNGGAAFANVNPGLAAFNNKLYLVLNTVGTGSTGPGFGSSFNAFNGAGWGPSTGIPLSAPVDSAPGMASDGTYLYIGYRNQNDQTLELCRMDINEAVTCRNFPGTTQMNFNPSLKVFGGVLYIAFEALDNSHNLYYFTSTDQGQTISNTITTAAGDQSGTAPSLEQHNNYLYMGFRTNDGDHKFLYKYSGDGVNWTGSIDPHYTMGGPPVLVDGANVQNYQNILYNLFSQNDSAGYLFSSYGQ